MGALPDILGVLLEPPCVCEKKKKATVGEKRENIPASMYECGLGAY